MPLSLVVRAAKLILIYKFFRECYGTPKVLFITAAMGVVQTVGAQLPPLAYKIVACIFFAGMSLKSRVFAVLDARRPELGSDLGNKIMVETKRPSWTPPGLSLPYVHAFSLLFHFTFAYHISSFDAHEVLHNILID
jgi:hypothetical protein